MLFDVEFPKRLLITLSSKAEKRAIGLDLNQYNVNRNISKVITNFPSGEIC